MHRKSLIAGVVASVVVAMAAAQQASALRVAMPNRTPAQQVMTAEVVVIGKVAEIEKEPTKATQVPGATDKIDYQVAVVKISESVLGAKGLTNVRVGFLTAPMGGNVKPLPPNGGGIQIQPAIARVPNPVITLTEGQEGCFFLTKHHDGDFYVLQQFGQPLDKKAADFDKQLDSVKKLVKVFEDPKAALKSKESADREFAACMLVQKYRQYPQSVKPNAKVVQEPIDAEESKLILSTLAEMPWGKVDPNGVGLQNTFYQLGLQPKDGWTQPKFQKGVDFNKVMGDAVVKWMKENAEKYQIQRQVVK